VLVMMFGCLFGEIKIYIMSYLSYARVSYSSRFMKHLLLRRASVCHISDRSLELASVRMIFA